MERKSTGAVAAFRSLSGFLSWVGGIGIFLLMIPTVLDVAYRYTYGASLAGMVEYSEVGIVFVVYLGVAKAMQDGVHIATPVVTSRLAPRRAETARLAGQFVLWALVAYAVYRTGLSAIDATRIGEFRLGYVSVPTWPARSMVTFGFALLFIEIGIEIVERLRRLAAHR